MASERAWFRERSTRHGSDTGLGKRPASLSCGSRGEIMLSSIGNGEGTKLAYCFRLQRETTSLCSIGRRHRNTPRLPVVPNTYLAHTISLGISTLIKPRGTGVELRFRVCRLLPSQKKKNHPTFTLRGPLINPSSETGKCAARTP